MNTTNISGQTDIADLLSYIESFGSARLHNCFRSAIGERRMPYATLDEYLADPLQTRFAKLNRIPNLGKKTAAEFDKLAEEYSERSDSTLVKKGLESDVLVEQESRESNSSASMEIERTLLLDRYSNLTAREKDVIERRFGIERDTKQTLEEVGKDYDVTRERIRQIESKALRKMRSAQIVKSWELFINENFSQLIDVVFDGAPVIRQPSKLSGELALAVAIIHRNVSGFLKERARRFEAFWVRPDFDMLEIQTTRNRLAACAAEGGSLPLSIIELAKALDVNQSLIDAAVSALKGHRVYCGWVIRGSATSRKRRIVNILNLFHERRIDSPVSLWDMKVAYWSNYDDKCSGRDLLICLQEHNTHFVNLRELGWVCLTAEPNEDPCYSISLESQKNVPDELYTKPVKTGHGLANCVYEMFEKHGPQRLSDAAEIFQREYSQYSISSMYPMLVYFAVFLRFAPGIIGIQTHCRDSNAINSAREIMLKERDLDLYLLSRVAGPPSLRYPLWDLEMEQKWANWAAEIEDFSRLGALLNVAKISDWEVGESERSSWENQKRQLDARVNVPTMQIAPEKWIDTGMLTTALAAASVFGYVNWMYLNQSLGWRVETTRVGLVLAVLIRIGALKPSGTWSEPHMLTKTGRQISRSIFGRSILPALEPRKTMADFLVEPVELQTDTGWAREYDFEQLLNQITDISDKQIDLSSNAGKEGSDVEAAYEGFMGDELRKLIGG